MNRTEGLSNIAAPALMAIPSLMVIPPLGTRAPEFALPDGRSSSSLRGTPLILAFSPPDWNPAREETLSLFNALVGEFGPPGTRLLNLRAEQDGCALSTSQGEEHVPMHALESHSEAAARFGVEGQNALFALDEEGIVRWQCVWSQGSAPLSGEVISALQELSPRPVPPQAVISGANPRDNSQPTNTLATNAPGGRGLSRRTFLASALAASFALAAGPLLEKAGAQNLNTVNQPEGAVGTPESFPLTLNINGQSRQLRVDARVSLLDALREHLGLTGTKKGCDHGQCGACTVHLDGERSLSCLTLAVMSDGRKITTIEGLAQGANLHPVQQAFLDHDGYQCGYCTPGQIMSAVALLREGHAHSDAEIRDAMSGNLCRCGAYPNIIAAIKSVRTENTRNA